jgi:hypothetical protein
VTTATTWRCRTALLLSGLLLITGCGGGPAAPVDQVPGLADALGRVDSAIADHRYAQARLHLNDLVETTLAARETGDLESEQADQVLAVAAHLMSTLPTAQPTRQAPRKPSRKPAPAQPNRQTRDQPAPSEDWDKRREELAKKLEEERKKLEEERKRLEEEEKQEEEGDGGGNGDSSENGPDDGEGN